MSIDEGHRPQNPKGPLRLYRTEKVEVEIQEAVIGRPSKNRVFLLRLPSQHARSDSVTHIHRVWEQVWKAAGNTPPQLLIIDEAYELTSLTDDQLLSVGLMRIEKPYEEKETASP